MKKLFSLVLVACLVLALGVTAFADFSYDAESGRIVGTHEAAGKYISVYVNGEGAGAGTDSVSISYPVAQGEEDAVANITIKEDFVDVAPVTVTIPGTKAAEEPGEQPGDEPGEQPGDQPGEKPADETKPADNAPAKTDSKGAGVPKTGEVDYTVALVVLALAGTAGMIVTGKKYGEN